MSQEARKTRRIGICFLLTAGMWLAGREVCAAQGDFPPHGWVQRFLPEDLPKLEYPRYYNDLDKARAQVMAGRFKMALITLAKAKDAEPIEAALLQGQAPAATGRKAAAIDVLSRPGVSNDPKVQVARARVLSEMGREPEAIALLKDQIAKHPDAIAGHYYLGEINEQIGDTAAAKSAYGWFVEGEGNLLAKWLGQGTNAFEDAQTVTLLGRAVDRWACLTGAYKENAKLHNATLDIFVNAYDVIDRSYWPARVAAAEYFMAHDDNAGAHKQLQAALSANPNDVAALRLMGQIALQSWSFEGVEQVIDDLRKVDPDSIDADLLDCRNLLLQRRAKDALVPAQRVLARQPKHLEAMGLVAASYALQVDDAKTAEILKQVETIDADNSTAYLEVAEQLGAMRQYPRSAAMYKVAIERAPWWTAPRNGLGLLYTQSGDEDQARATLDAAHALDPFNLATTNYLRLLDEMDKFARSETAHFIVLYDAKADPVIPEYFGEYLESIYKDVCGVFKHEPSVKTIIEVFPAHDAFSVRTTGSPWIGTVGASTGRVIALVSPRNSKGTMGSFNWAQVLRHEFTHTVTLSATDNRIAHWMTEGLAVYEERIPLRWEWVPMLYDAVKKNELFPMDQLTWGFVRPKRPIDRQLAYAQSYWICKYINEKYGHESILKMLELFRQGKTQDEAFPAVLKRSLSEFSTEFFAWTRDQVATWGYDEATTKKYEELRTKGESLVASKQYAEAAKIWEQIAKIRPVDPLAHKRLAGLYLTKTLHDPGKAAAHLEALSKVELKDDAYCKRVSRVYRDMNKTDEALTYAIQAVYTDPYDLDAHELLAQLYEKSGNTSGAEKENRVIPVLQKWIEDHRRGDVEKEE